MSGWRIRHSGGKVHVASDEARGFTLPVDLDRPRDVERLRAVLTQFRGEVPAGLPGAVIEAESPGDHEVISRLLKEMAADYQQRASGSRARMVAAVRSVLDRGSSGVLPGLPPGLLVALGVLGVLVVLQMAPEDDAPAATGSDATAAYGGVSDVIDRLLNDLSDRLRAEGVDGVQSMTLDWSAGDGVTVSLRLAHPASQVRVVGRGVSLQDSVSERARTVMTAWAGNPALRTVEGALAVTLPGTRVSPGGRQRSLDEKRVLDIGARQGVIPNVQRSEARDVLEVRVQSQPVGQVVRFADDVLAQGSWSLLEIRRADGPSGLVSLTGRIPVAEER